MFKRVLCVMAAVMVASSSAMAWTAESFIGNDYDEQETYDFEPVYDYPMQPMRMMSARSTASASEMYELDFLNPTSIEWMFPQNPYANLMGTQSIYLPTIGDSIESPFVGGYVALPSTVPSVNISGNSYRFGSGQYTLNYSYDDDSISTFVGWDYYNFNGLIVEYDIPVPQDSYAVSFSPYLWARSESTINEIYEVFEPANCSFIVDDKIVKSIDFDQSGVNFYTEESTYSYTSPISSLKVVFTFRPSQRHTTLPSAESGSLVCFFRGYIRSESTLSIGFLGDHSALNMHNQEGQDSINEHNAIESEWTGSMTSNFNALSIETFSFPFGLVSAFGLITGIFNDLWNGMGEYKIAYVFPLTLGIALLLIGRISKFAGGQSSGKRNRGDDGA